jgi:FkbM family methyltransferase
VQNAAAVTASTGQKSGLASMLRPDTDIVVADIGAMLLGEHKPDYQRLLDAGVARIVGFEPNAAEHARLENAFPAPHVFHRAFIGSGGPATYYETSETMTGSLYEPNTPLLANYAGLSRQVALVARHPVETSTLDDVLGATDVDMIKIDVQGGELDVFKGAGRALANAVVVHTEVEFAELYKGQPLFGDIDRHLNEAGFQFLTFFGMSGRPMVAPSGAHAPEKLRATQLLWADAVYVPKITGLGNLASDKLTKLACITHLLYGANDVAWRALSELDARDGGRRAQHFSDQVKTR